MSGNHRPPESLLYQVRTTHNANAVRLTTPPSEPEASRPVPSPCTADDASASRAVFGPAGSVDKARLQRVVDVMQQFLGFPAFNINSMLVNGG